jgi:pimeloyl-ACP methyl ester carboxylesterase
MSSTWFAVLLAFVPGDERTRPTLSKADLEKLVDRYFDAPRAEQLAIEERLDELDPLDEKGVAAWKTKLFARAKKGKKASFAGVNYLLDEKKELGKYLVDDDKSGRLVVCMHGGGQGSGDAESAKGAFSGTLSKLGVLAVYPEVLRATEHGWGEDDTERFVIELIEAVKRARKVDVDRIYLTGHSMGGYGTYTIGARHADTFAGLAAFAGAPTPYFDERRPGEKIVYDIEDGILPNLRNLPIFFYQSLDDRNVTPEVNVWLSQRFPQLASEFGAYRHRCEIVDGRGHAAPEQGYEPGLRWTLEHARNPVPSRVLWQPVRSWKRMFYWLWWEDPQLGAELDVEIVKEKNQIEIRTKVADAKKLALFVDARMLDVGKDVVVRWNGDARFRVKPKHRLSTLLRTIATRNDPGLAFSMRLDLF